MKPVDGMLMEATARVTILDAAKALGIPLRMGAQKSPFREDKRPSFSVFGGGKGFKDHAMEDHRGGLMRFLQLAMPNSTARDRVQFVLKLAGMPADREAGAAWAGKVVRRRASRPQPPKGRRWTNAVEDRYQAGLNVSGGLLDVAIAARCAKERGWPVEFATALGQYGKGSYPALPWDDGKRGVAFKVERPEVVDGRLELDPVGYHQRFWAGGTRKAWVYVPYNVENPRTAFQRALNGHVPPYPFVALSWSLEEVWVLEGQWDAWTLACVMGGCGMSHRSTVLGLRGASSGEVFMRSWLPILRAAGSKVFILGDADKAGAQVWDLGNESSLAARVQRAGLKVVAGPFREAGVKDFNDYYRAHPDVTGMEVMSWVR